ncbi:hypothetical protein L3V86_08030 [Thiotrichales bacterium 19S11-10]|nr:hypothetical protein [Thiotrichales bacterium 19S11-10]
MALIDLDAYFRVNTDQLQGMKNFIGKHNKIFADNNDGYFQLDGEQYFCTPHTTRAIIKTLGINKEDNKLTIKGFEGDSLVLEDALNTAYNNYKPKEKSMFSLFFNSSKSEEHKGPGYIQ